MPILFTFSNTPAYSSAPNQMQNHLHSKFSKDSDKLAKQGEDLAPYALQEPMSCRKISAKTESPVVRQHFICSSTLVMYSIGFL